MMKSFLSVLSLFLLAAAAVCQGPPAVPPPPAPPRVCLASVDDKGIVRLRYYRTSPPVKNSRTYIQEVEGKPVQKTATIEQRHISEQILTLPVIAVEVYL